jgi:hypothetical protein
VSDDTSKQDLVGFLRQMRTFFAETCKSTAVAQDTEAQRVAEEFVANFDLAIEEVLLDKENLADAYRTVRDLYNFIVQNVPRSRWPREVEEIASRVVTAALHPKSRE